LLSSPSRDCYDSEWFSFFGVTFLGIAFVIVVPIILFVVLYRNRWNMHSNRVYWRYGRLVVHYTPKFYYWEVVHILWKTIFVCIVDLTNSWQKFERAFLMIIFLALQFFVESFVNPYDKNSAMIFEMRSA
jgi:hypothetical protein